MREHSTKLSKPWYLVYRELADALYKFYKRDPKSAARRLYEACSDNISFVESQKWFQNLNSTKVIDPVHVFASISNGRRSFVNRTKLIKLYFKILKVKTSQRFDKLDFTGCPAPTIIQIIASRSKPVTAQIWEAFAAAKLHKALGLDSNLFDRLKGWFGINITSFTIFLFWIDYTHFIPLDSKTVSLLKLYKRISKFPKTVANYRNLLTGVESNLYLNLAAIAHDSEYLETLASDEKRQIQHFLGKEASDLSSKAFANRTDFKLFAMRILENCSLKQQKILRSDSMFYFYQDYIIAGDEIKYLPDKSIGIYNTDRLNINISAIVGKNGTGKSTIIEILLATLNNLSIRFLPRPLESTLMQVEQLFVELYFKGTFVYKIVVKGADCSVEKYELINDHTYGNREIVNDFDFQDLFYTISVNYSQYALNSLNVGCWIEALFHKNDAYQTPIVIEPYRKTGNIDINVQQDLLNSRLLSNLLETEQESDEGENQKKENGIIHKPKSAVSFLDITSTLRAEKLKFSLEDSKVEYLYNKEMTPVGFEALNDSKGFLKALFEKFEVREVSTSLDADIKFRVVAKKYILRKLVSICRNYRHYNKYFDEKRVVFINFKEFLDRLVNDKSHVTFKFRQAINFLKYDTIKGEEEILVKDLAARLNKIRTKEDKHRHRLEELIPPSFFKYKLILSKGVSFDSISSGEKQKIFSLNSILYHIKNIDSVASSDELIKYGCVNILLDEIELYFHPEFQRTYISYLIESLRKLNLEWISSINVCFVTHSPFILSDIPRENILFLTEPDSDAPDEGLKTFGANIHELLTGGFFMGATVGAFAAEHASRLIKFHQEVISEYDNENIAALKKRYDSLKNTFHLIVDRFGEEYLRKILANHVRDIERKLNDKTYLQKEVTELEHRLRDLNSQLNA